MAAVTWYGVLAGGEEGEEVPHYSDLEVHLHF